jgi:hypothetical protein
MSIIGDIHEVIQTIKDMSASPAEIIKSIKDLKLKSRGGESIVRRSKDSILNFPVLFSSGVSKESLTMVTKSLENQYSTFVRLLITRDDLMDVNSNTSSAKTAFIQKFHQNIDFDTVDDLGSAATNVKSVLDTARNMSESEKNIFDSLNKENMVIIEEDLNQLNLNDMTIKSYLYFNEDENEKKLDFVSKISDTDAKKANDLTPTVLDLTIKRTIKGEKGDTLDTTSLLVGIKAVAHVIPANEMSYFISRSLKENSLIFRLIQWTTGEIKFFRDFMLNLDTVKEEANRTKNVSAKWWHKLKQLSLSNKLAGLFNTKKFIPNVTMVVTMDEIEYMKNTNGINLQSPANVQKLMKIFFLMGFAILDEIDGIAYFYDEDARQFRHYSYESLKKEERDSSSIKALVSLMSR